MKIVFDETVQRQLQSQLLMQFSLNAIICSLVNENHHKLGKKAFAICLCKISIAKNRFFSAAMRLKAATRFPTAFVQHKKTAFSNHLINALIF
jgi:hypothetical protein